jgi:hypothetical protein
VKNLTLSVPDIPLLVKATVYTQLIKFPKNLKNLTLSVPDIPLLVKKRERF